MVTQQTVLRGLEALPPRPPTPPRENTQEAQAHGLPSLDPRRSLYTPPGYSPTSSEGSETNSKRAQKKVGFSSQAEYREAFAYAEDAQRRPTPTSASLTPSASRPIKSILKPSPQVEPNPLEPSAGKDDATSHANLATMLDSTIQQLAGADRESRLDAYMMVQRALKSSNNLPDRIALQDKMSLFTQFIQRDLTTKTANGSIDWSLAKHALTLLTTFLHFPAIASTISNEFGVFIIDHCIRSFEDHSVPKDCIRSLMAVVGYQKFPSKVMTADRVGRLVTSLRGIEDHWTGKSIIMGRIMVYRQLVQQSKLHMTSHSDWLSDLFTDMLSDMRETRDEAITLGLEVGFTIAKERQIPRKVMEVFKATIGETQYMQYYLERLEKMTVAKDSRISRAVPRIWSVVILLMRCPLQRWEHSAAWLAIIQKCFNSSDSPTKFEANYAWNRLVYTLQFNEKAFPKDLRILSQPLWSQLKRKAATQQEKELRNVVLGSVCNLFYYAFKPNTSQSQLDVAWGDCVVPCANSSSTSSKECIQQMTLILSGLLDATRQRYWREDRVAGEPLAKAEQIPAIDSKWVRHNAEKVFEVVGPLLSKNFMDLSNSASASHKLWKTLVGAVAFASSKEIKVSTDTTIFMAQAFTLLAKVWCHGLDESIRRPGSSDKFFEATAVFLSTMTEALGHLPFTEKRLCMGKQNTFAVTTPSSRPSKGQGVAKTPLHHLFSIMSTLPPGTNDDEGLSCLVGSILNPFLATKTPRARLELAHELYQSVHMDTLSPCGPWIAISEVISQELLVTQGTQSSTPVDDSQPPVGHEYREVVRHLERGFKSTPNLPWQQWCSLFQILATRATEDTGEAGCAIAIIEPLAKSVLGVLSNEYEAKIGLTLYKCGIALVSSARQPRDRQALDAGRRRLWGTSVAGSRSASFDPYDHLYKLTSHLLDVAYRQDEVDNEEVVVPLLTETANFLARCNKLLVCKTLINLQDSIGLWIQDANGRHDGLRTASLCEAVKFLWAGVCNIFSECNLSQVELGAIEPLLCSAFESKHSYIVDGVSALWNQAFENVDEVEYPERLKTILLTLTPYVDLVLPGLETSSYESSGQQSPFVEPQDLADGTDISKRTVLANTPRQETPSSTKRSTRRSGSTNGVGRRKSRRSTPKRLRHDSSQLDFATIPSSSPTTNDANTQVLTERQCEIRERQRENAALFPEIRSSIQKHAKSRSPQPNNPPVVSDERNAATPKTHRSFEVYGSSTPTPRRGQAPALDDNDQEMTDDVPSSPPDPRRYPLLPDMKKGMSSGINKWAFGSSPVSGSPLQNPPGQIRTDENIMDGSNVDGDDATGDAGILPSLPKTPATPSHTRQVKVQETPRSDNEVYVDAPTSPVPQNMRLQRAASGTAAVLPAMPNISQLKGSFDTSDIDERSMLRLVVEVDSRKSELKPNDSTLPKPGQRSPSPALDCITVSTDSTKRRSKSNLAKDAATGPMNMDESPSLSQKSKQKRKRVAEGTLDSGEKKRKIKEAVDANVDAVPDSQLPTTNDNASLEQWEIFGEERASSPSQGSSDQEVDTGQHALQQGPAGKAEDGNAAVSMHPAPAAFPDASTNAFVEEDIIAASFADAGTQTVVDAPVAPEQLPIEKVMDALRGGLDILQTMPSLSREDVYRVEGMFMDIKRALYDAENRGR